MKKIRDCFWVWGHPAGAHDKGWGFERHSRMTTMECCTWLGVPNALMINYDGIMKPPLDQEAMIMDTLDQVIWSIVGAAKTMGNDNKGYIEEVCRIARKYPNIKGGVFDDFFTKGHMEERSKDYSPARMIEVRKQMKENPGAPLDLWVVLYENDLMQDIAQEFDAFDGILFWTWFGENLQNFDNNFAKAKELASEKRYMIGCYLYDYGNHKQFDAVTMKYQLEKYVNVVRKGEAEGIILLSNTIADLGFEAVKYTRQWLRDHGDEIL